MSNKNDEDRIKEREKMLMRFMIIVGIIALMGMCSAQDEEITVIDPFWEDEDPPIIILPEKPFVFPEELPKASHEISINYYGLMGEINITNFDQDWLDFLNQTNLTA